MCLLTKSGEELSTCPGVGASSGGHQSSTRNQLGEGETSTVRVMRQRITGGKEVGGEDEELLNVEGEGEAQEVLMLKSYRRKPWVKMQLSRRPRL